MNIMLIVQMILAALGAVFLYTIIGFIPGTDETSVLLPITLTVALAGTPPIIVLTFFIAAIVTLNLTNAMPTALVGLPGGVMSSPMLEHSLFLKEKGMSAMLIKKMAVGALIGMGCSIPTALVLANVLAPYAKNIQVFAPLLFFLGTIFLSLMGKNRTLSLLSVIPMAMLFMALRHLYWGLGVVPREVNITTSFFLGITIGPLLVSLFTLLNKTRRMALETKQMKIIVIPGEVRASKALNPFEILFKSEMVRAALPAFIASFLFVLSPVGLTILFGEAMANRIKDPVKKAMTAVVTMSALGQATYLSGIIIPIMGIGLPLSPSALGPGGALFNAPPVFTVENNLYHILDTWEFILAIMIGAITAMTITYYIVNRLAGKISVFVLQRIPHEAILGLFVSFILLLAYMDAGLINVFGVLLIGIICGTLNNMGVSYGIQFMTLYAAPWIVEKLSSL